MTRPQMAAVALVLVVLVVLAFPSLYSAWQKSSVASRCASLQDELRAVNIQGGDSQRAAALRAEIAACITEAKDLGVDINEGAALSASCETALEQIEQEWTHYRSTVDVDAITRNNTRGTMLRQCEDAARCFNTAINAANDRATLEKIIATILAAKQRAIARNQCFNSGAAGCSRFGVNEPTGNERAADEETRCIVPLQRALVLANAKLRPLLPASTIQPDSVGGSSTNPIVVRGAVRVD